MSKFLKSLFTDADWDADVILVLLFIAVLSLIVLASITIERFDPVSFGSGVAAILGGGGVGYGARRFGDSQMSKGVPEPVKEVNPLEEEFVKTENKQPENR